MIDKLYQIGYKMLSNSLKYSISGIICLLLFAGCGTTKYIPVENSNIINYIDSVRYVVKDSTVLIPIERYVDIVAQYDTLVLETSQAKSVSYVDTTLHLLRGEIENKGEIQYRDRIIYKDKIEYRDSIVVKQVPYEVEVIKNKIPKWVWFSLGFNILIILLIALKIYLKLV